MPESLIASTQYGDMMGTVQFDGHDAAPLEELAALTEMPQNFCPIGIRMGLPNTLEEIVPFSVLAFDYDLVGQSPEAMDNFIANHGKLPLVEYHGTFHFSQFMEFFKRWSLVAYHKSVAGQVNEMEIYTEEEWREKHFTAMRDRYPAK